MEATAMTQTLVETMLDPVVLVIAALVTLALLTGSVARLVELFDRT